MGAAAPSTTSCLALQLFTNSKATANSRELCNQVAVATISSSRTTLCGLQAESTN